jgi:diguanylate cyclase (GGDEF)-like protein/putative nucleotidyltransferase with HDIG domain
VEGLTYSGLKPANAVLTSRPTRKDPPSQVNLLLWQDVRARAIDQHLDADRRAVGERVAELFRWLFLVVFAAAINLNGLTSTALVSDGLLVVWTGLNVGQTVLVLRGHRPSHAYSVATLGLDIVFGGVLLHLAGTFHNAAFLAYFLVVIAGSMRLGTVAALGAALAISLIYLYEGAATQALSEVAGRVFLVTAVALSTGLMSRELERERRMAISRAAQADTLREMNVGMASSIDIKDVFEVILQHGLKMSSADSGGVALVIDDQVEAVAGTELDEPAVRRAAQRGEAVFLEQRQTMVVPLASGDGVTAVLGLKAQSRPFSNEDLLMVNALAGSAAVTLANALHYQRSAQEAISDGLTGLFNHREFRRRLETEFVRAQRRGTPLSVMIIDLDHFKTVNDSMGHQHGDEVLIAAASVLRQTARAHDVVARYGGDELAIVLVEATPAGARIVAERLMDAVHAAQVVTSPGSQLTFSLGVASFPEDALTANELVMAADQALYQAKREGRDRCRVFSGLVGQMEASPDEMLAMLTASGPQVMVAIGRALDGRRPGMAGHTSRVVAVVETVARQVDYPPLDLEDLRAIAYLHDVGTVSPTGQDGAHAVAGQELIAKAPFPPRVAAGVRSHHERWDGAGRPDGLAGSDIPLEARIVGLAEAFEDLTSGRGQRPPVLPSLAVDELAADTGAYDPALLAALRSFVDQGGLPLGPARLVAAVEAV